MFRRESFIPMLTVASVAMIGAAAWKVIEMRKAAGDLAVVHIRLVEPAREGAASRAAEAGLSPGEAEELRANLAAARQRLSVAETAAKETEDRLSEEISKRVALEKKNSSLTEDLSAAQKSVDAAEAKAERAVSELAKIEAVLPASRLAPPDLVAQPADTGAKTGPETTASIDKSDDEAGDQEKAADATAAPDTPGSDAAAEAATETKAPPRRSVRRYKKKSKPKEEYFLDSLFN